MSKIRIAIAGVGNCASSLVQGIYYYAQQPNAVGLMHEQIGGWRVDDMEVVAAFDVDARKVGRPLEEALFALPNNTKQFFPNIPPTGVTVQMGPILDGIAPHMADYPVHLRFEPSKATPVDVAQVLAESGAEILINYLPVGSEQATAVLCRGVPENRREPRELHPGFHCVESDMGRAIHRSRNPLHRR